ncbi:glycoside hydrolase family 26 protein [Gephyromycinifex aptenodytis]|uniref:hypothetical protein n=1 Tax=Gephyromycinifex aptenodytis TaxID=2716227 RepID=UPI001446717D|nr:hypothetical protein [Gephyromycinifex aptenodytis]
MTYTPQHRRPTPRSHRSQQVLGATLTLLVAAAPGGAHAEPAPQAWAAAAPNVAADNADLGAAQQSEPAVANEADRAEVEMPPQTAAEPAPDNPPPVTASQAAPAEAASSNPVAADPVLTGPAPVQAAAPAPTEAGASMPTGSVPAEEPPVEPVPVPTGQVSAPPLPSGPRQPHPVTATAAADSPTDAPAVNSPAEHGASEPAPTGTPASRQPYSAATAPARADLGSADSAHSAAPTITVPARDEVTLFIPPPSPGEAGETAETKAVSHKPKTPGPNAPGTQVGATGPVSPKPAAPPVPGVGVPATSPDLGRPAAPSRLWASLEQATPAVTAPAETAPATPMDPAAPLSPSAPVHTTGPGALSSRPKLPGARFPNLGKPRQGAPRPAETTPTAVSTAAPAPAPAPTPTPAPASTAEEKKSGPLGPEATDRPADTPHGTGKPEQPTSGTASPSEDSLGERILRDLQRILGTPHDRPTATATPSRPQRAATSAPERSTTPPKKKPASGKATKKAPARPDSPSEHDSGRPFGHDAGTAKPAPPVQPTQQVSEGHSNDRPSTPVTPPRSTPTTSTAPADPPAPPKATSHHPSLPWLPSATPTWAPTSPSQPFTGSPSEGAAPQTVITQHPTELPSASASTTRRPPEMPQRGTTRVGSRKLALPLVSNPMTSERVAGPGRPAPGGVSTPSLPPPSGSPASTVALYPDVPSPRAGSTWASGTHLRVDSPAAAPGRPNDVVVATVQAPSWDSLRQAEVVDRLPTARGRAVISAPLLPEHGASLQQCVNGEYDQAWDSFAARIAAAGIQSPVVEIGAGMNVEGRPFSADPAAFASCYRRAAGAVKKALPQAQLQWTVSLGSRAGMPQDSVLRAWPGADVVDVVGVQALDIQPWAQQVNGDFGLNYWAGFAARNGKRIAVSQWGIHPSVPTSLANAAYVQNMHDWLARTAEKGALAYDAYTAPAYAQGRPADEAYRALFHRSH